MDIELQKKQAGEYTVNLIEDGMKLGLGTGSTVKYFIDALANKVKEGLKVCGVPTSTATAKQAETLGIELISLDEVAKLDLTIDGADEIDGNLNLIKGGGGALLREKIVAMASDKMVVIADSQKKVKNLGQFPLPIEVVPFGKKATLLHIEELLDSLGYPVQIKQRECNNGETFLTDNNNIIYDCKIGLINNPELLANKLSVIPGIVEHGLFINITNFAFIGNNGEIKIINR